MKVLNLRNVPDELMRELRAQAALADMPFHEFCVRLLRESLAVRKAAKEWSYKHPHFPYPEPPVRSVEEEITPRIPAPPDSALPPGHAPRVEDMRFESAPNQEIEIT